MNSINPGFTFQTCPLRRSLCLLAAASAVACSSAHEEETFFADSELPDSEAQQFGSSKQAITGGERIDVAYFGANNHARSTVFLDLGGSQDRCSGLKVRSRKFLTAAHCLEEMNPGDQFELTHSIRGLFQAWPVKATVESVDLHPSWQGTAYSGRDIAVLTIEETTYIETFTGPFDYNFIPHGDWGRAVAYGCDNAGDGDWRKQRGDFQAYTRSSSPPGGVFDAMHYYNIVSYTPGIQICGGDSGGPLFQYWNGQWRLIGVINGRVAGSGRSTFTRINLIQSWLEDMLDD